MSVLRYPNALSSPLHSLVLSKTQRGQNAINATIRVFASIFNANTLTVGEQKKRATHGVNKKKQQIRIMVYRFVFGIFMKCYSFVCHVQQHAIHNLLVLAEAMRYALLHGSSAPATTIKRER